MFGATWSNSCPGSRASVSHLSPASFSLNETSGLLFFFAFVTLFIASAHVLHCDFLPFSSLLFDSCICTSVSGFVLYFVTECNAYTEGLTCQGMIGRMARRNEPPEVRDISVLTCASAFLFFFAWPTSPRGVAAETSSTCCVDPAEFRRASGPSRA